MTNDPTPAPAAPVSEHLLAKALLDEKRKDRRLAYIKYAVLAVVGLAYVALFFYGVRYMQPDLAASGPYAAVVEIRGEIGPNSAINARTVNPLLRAAFEDEGAKAVILLINSPGGTPAQSHLIRQRILELREQHGKRVYAVGEDLLTSGAYMVASAAHHIVADPNTIVGSIGVVSRSFGFTGLMQRLGVERRVMTAGEAKNLLDPFSPQTEAGLQMQAQLLQTVHENFVEAVKAGRGERLAQAPELFSGQAWVGEDALRLGLVDELGSLETVKARLGVQRVRVYRAPAPLIERLLTNAAVHTLRQLATDASLAQAPQALP